MNTFRNYGEYQAMRDSASQDSKLSWWLGETYWERQEMIQTVPKCWVLLTGRNNQLDIYNMETPAYIVIPLNRIQKLAGQESSLSCSCKKDKCHAGARKRWNGLQNMWPSSATRTKKISKNHENNFAPQSVMTIEKTLPWARAAQPKRLQKEDTINCSLYLQRPQQPQWHMLRPLTSKFEWQCRQIFHCPTFWWWHSAEVPIYLPFPDSYRSYS